MGRRNSKNRTTCTLISLRMTTRNTARLFDSTLAPVELQSTQFTMLTTIEGHDGSSINELATILAMGRTTLTRNLKSLELRKRVRSAADEDKRMRRVHITLS
jgi:DNA-binding MarR family transcriptional regulator